MTALHDAVESAAGQAARLAADGGTVAQLDGGAVVLGRRGTDRDPLALAVLAYLGERPMHPYELGKLLRKRNTEESIKYRHASLYTVVEQLHRDGYLAAQETRREGRRPERTVYRLTDAGRAELLDRMRELVSVPAKEYRRFEAVLALIAVLPPGEAAELLEARLRGLGEQADQLRAHLRKPRDVDRLFLVEHEYRLGLLEAELRFVERFLEMIREGRESLGPFWWRLHATGTPSAP